jgi:hypothetical protein
VSGARVLEGNIQLVENAASAELQIVDNRVAGNLQVFKNGGSGNTAVRANTVGQSLQCKENGGSFAGGPNAAGEVEGQCF